MQDPYRFLAAKKFEQIINKKYNYNVQYKRYSYIVKQIKNKLVTCNAMLTQADKGRTIVIITQNAYTGKVHTFLLTISPTCPKIQPQNTTTFYKKTLQECNLIIDKQNIKYLLQKKPTPPTLKARIKLHKQDKPIRPVVNNTKSPIYNWQNT